MRTREVTHIHQNKHGWPLRARSSICSELPSCWAWLGSLTVNLYTIILSPALTRHLLLWRAKCLCARTPRPLLSLEFCLHAWARNIKGHMGEKKSSPWASALLTEPGFCQTWRGRFISLKYTKSCSQTLIHIIRQWGQTAQPSAVTKRVLGRAKKCDLSDFITHRLQDLSGPSFPPIFFSRSYSCIIHKSYRYKGDYFRSLYYRAPEDAHKNIYWLILCVLVLHLHKCVWTFYVPVADRGPMLCNWSCGSMVVSYHVGTQNQSWVLSRTSYLDCWGFSSALSQATSIIIF